MTPPDAEPTTKEERHQHLKDLAALDAEQGGLSTLNRDFTRRLCTQVEAMEASLKSQGVCDICWTTSWEPVENEKDCAIDEHPHLEQACFRCGQCTLVSTYQKLKVENERLREQVDALELRLAIISRPGGGCHD